jgi:hypothetical protein
MVDFSTDARQDLDDWILPIEGDGGIAHILNVVGYGVAISPFTLQPQPYFLLRDSFVQKPMHYRISALSLVQHLIGVSDVQAVEILP